jgi:hypothetical protein
MDTPEFLIWALEYTCQIRGFQDGSDPERTERQLRAGRAVTDARSDGRVFEEFCVDPPNGFRIADALGIYAGLSVVERTCGACPANALKERGGLAGCFGLLALWRKSPDIHAVVERAIDEAGLTARYQQLFPPTQPRWYGLWIASPLGMEQQAFIVELLEAMDAIGLEQPALDELKRGLQAALPAGVSVHAKLHPAGRVEATCWKLAPHCPRCRGPWGEPNSRRCAICSYFGHPAPNKKRRARGQRPYYPLDRLLGAQQAADLLVRYEAFRKQHGPTAPAQSQPPAAPPGNPPVG